MRPPRKLYSLCVVQQSNLPVLALRRAQVVHCSSRRKVSVGGGVGLGVVPVACEEEEKPPNQLFRKDFRFGDGNGESDDGDVLLLWVWFWLLLLLEEDPVWRPRKRSRLLAALKVEEDVDDLAEEGESDGPPG